MNRPKIRKAELQDLDSIKAIADANRKELGFVRRLALKSSIEQNELLVAGVPDRVLGFVQYHHRLDKQTTIHNIVVVTGAREQGIGRSLFEALCKEASQKQQTNILLKCPENLPANKFYFHLGLRQVALEPGKARRLRIWRRRLKTCAEAQSLHTE